MDTCYICYKSRNINDFSKTQIKKGIKKKCKYCIINKVKLKIKLNLIIK